MDFLSELARQHRIPRPVVKDATTALLLLLQRFARPEESSRLVRELPLARELLGVPIEAERKSALVTWISGLVSVATSGPRSIKQTLIATGLREAEIVPFVSAVVQHAVSETDPELMGQLVRRVPGLTRLVALPPDREADQ